MFYVECVQVQIWMCRKSLQWTGICSGKSKFILNYGNIYVDRSRKEFGIFSNGMIYPVQKFSNRVEDKAQKATFSSNNLP
jgi:hypothetical protein